MLIAGRVGGSGGGVLASSEVGVVFLSLTLVFGGGAKESSERSSAKIQTHCGKTLNQVKLDTFSPQGMPLGLPASSSLNPIDDRLRRTCTGAPNPSRQPCLPSLYTSFFVLVFWKWKMGFPSTKTTNSLRKHATFRQGTSGQTLEFSNQI